MDNLLLRRRMMMAQGGLPYDAQVEYLQQQNDAIINTTLYDVDAIEIKYRVSSWSSFYTLFGNYIGGDYNVWRLILSNFSSSNNVGVYVGGRAIDGWNSVEGGARNVDHTIYMSKTNIVCDDVPFSGTINISQGFANTSPIAIFARSVTDPGWINVGMRCYYFKAWKNDNRILDLIPVRVGQVGYMYDRVSGQLFGNANVGDFILGPDVQ